MIDIRKIGVVGAGATGKSFTQLFAENGFAVVLVDHHETHLRNAHQTLSRSVRSGAFLNIACSHKYEELADCDLIVECVEEDERAKKKVFQTLDRLCKPDAVFATSTSGISITELSKTCKNPSRLIGIHAIIPPYHVKLVELVRGKKTGEDTVSSVRTLCDKIGKMSVIASDTPGYVAYRLILPYINEAIRLYETGVATREEIDLTARYGLFQSLGPLQLADYLGLDLCLDALTVLHKKLRDKYLKPSKLLQKLVKQKKLGRKTGEGFYKYEKP